MFDLPRTTPRAVWYYLYRMFRITQREALKASVDMLIYGQSAVQFFPDGRCEHVPFETWSSGGGSA